MVFSHKENAKARVGALAAILTLAGALFILTCIAKKAVSPKESLYDQNTPIVANESEAKGQEHDFDASTTVSASSPSQNAPNRNELEDIWEPVLDLGIGDEEIRTAMLRLSHGPLFERVGSQIEKVAGESIKEAIHNLYHVNMFFWPGAGPLNGRYVLEGDSLIPPSADVGGRDTKSILSNRRFLKVYEELSNMPVDEASALVSKELNLSFQQYLSAYSQDPQILSDRLTVSSIEKMLAEDPNQPIVGLGWISETPEESEMTLLGLRFKVLSLVWIAGSLELKATDAAVQEVIREAIRQRDGLYSDRSQSAFYKYQVLSQASLYNRQILVTGLLGTSARSGYLYSQIAQIGLERKKIRSTLFDAVATEYDQLVRFGPMRPDYAKGELYIYCFSAMNDETFDKAISLRSWLR